MRIIRDEVADRTPDMEAHNPHESSYLVAKLTVKGLRIEKRALMSGTLKAW